MLSMLESEDIFSLKLNACGRRDISLLDKTFSLPYTDPKFLLKHGKLTGTRETLNLNKGSDGNVFNRNSKQKPK